jgi:hypothetical protein
VLPTKFWFNWQSSFRDEGLKQELPVAAMFVANWDEMSNIYRGQGKICLFVFLMVFNATFNNI